MRAEPGASASPGGAPGDDRANGHSHDVQEAVELFIEMRSSGDAIDPAGFAARYPNELRPKILAQCREFLAFDGLLGHQEWEPAERPQPQGRLFGDFVIREELGRGGMGVVYLAHQTSLNRRVALKVMASGLTLSKRHVERFRREAAAAAQLRHPAIVPVHSLTEVDGSFAIAMDYVAGRNLADVIDDLRLANGDSPAAIEGSFGVAPGKGHVAECAMLCAQLASALAAAHEQGVVHRDLKPRNVMIDEKRQTRLLDFGLAKSLGEGSISMSGEITGTAHYMSPEQTLAKRVSVDHRADIFALGVILYELLTLKRPFDGKNLQQVVYEICFKEPVPIQKRNGKVPRDLVIICGKALEKDPQNRYQTAAEFEADLQRFLSWEPIHARPAGVMSRFTKFVRRHRTEVIAMTVVLGAGLAMLGWSFYESARNDRDADELLATAAAAHDRGDLDGAIRAATAALGKRDDATVRARLDVYHGESRLAAKQEEADIAEARRLGRDSALARDRDRELALLLALEADAKRSSAETRSFVLDALGSGYAATELRGHDKQVLAAEWSPDGGVVATAGDDGKVILWDAAARTQQRVLTGHSHWVSAVAFHPQGELIATASQDRTVRLWRVADGAPAGVWQHDGAVTMLQFDATGARALTTSYATDKGPFRAQVWDVAKGQRLAEVTHADHVLAAAISRCGRHVASWGGERGDVRLWDAATGTTLATLSGHTNRVRALEFSPDGTLVATAGQDGAVRLFAVPEGTPLAELHHSLFVDCLAFDADGGRLLTGSRDLTARMWSLRRDGGSLRVRELRTFVGATDQVMHVAFDPSGRFVATASKDGVLRIFDAGTSPTATGTELMKYELGIAVEACSFDRDGKSVLARGGKQRVVVWDFGKARGVVTLRQPGKVPAACFDPAGDRVVTAGDDERLRAWNAHDGSQVWVSERLGNPLRTVDVAATGDRVVCGTTDGRVAVHRLADGAPLFALPGHPGGVTVTRFVGDGSRILTAGDDNKDRRSPRQFRVALWNANDHSLVAHLDRPLETVAADVSPASLLATVDDGENVVRLWQLPDLAPRGELGGHRAAITSVQFAANGDAVLTASADGTALIQRMDGSRVATFAVGGEVHHAAWSRDGRFVLTCAEGGNYEARLWDVASTEEVLSFRGHRGTALSAAFSRDGAWAVSTSRDNTACIWPTDPVAVARRLPLRTLSETERRRHHLAPTVRK